MDCPVILLNYVSMSQRLVWLLSIMGFGSADCLHTLVASELIAEWIPWRQPISPMPQLRLPKLLPQKQTLPWVNQHFLIQSVQLTLPKPFISVLKQQGQSPPQWMINHWSWLIDQVKSQIGQSLEKKTLQSLLLRLTQQLIQRGLITSQIILPPQDLSTGCLTILLLPGIISKIHWVNSPLTSTGLQLLPLTMGAPLTLQDLEQTLEILSQGCQQQANIQLIADRSFGGSEVVITFSQKSSWQNWLGINSGSTDPALRLKEIAITGYSMGGMPHQLQLYYCTPLNSPLIRSHEQQLALRYLLFCRYHSYQLSASSYRRSQSLSKNSIALQWQQQITRWQCQIDWSLLRKPRHQLSVQLGCGQLHQQGKLNDIEIAVQKRRHWTLDYGFNYRYYRPTSQLELRISEHRAVPWFGATADWPSPAPTFYYRCLMIDLAWRVTLQIGQTPFDYFSVWHQQHSGQHLYTDDQLAITGHHRVRGFSDSADCRARNGFYWRQELSTALKLPYQYAKTNWVSSLRQQLFLGIDYGKIFGVAADCVNQQQCLGAAVGLRGNWPQQGNRLTFEIAVARPLWSTLPRYSSVAILSFSLHYIFSPTPPKP